MSRKDYVLIAAAIKAERDDWLDASMNPDAKDARAAIYALRALAGRLGHQMSLDNPRFSNERFMAACGF